MSKTAQNKKRGCFFYGCLVSIVAFLLVSAGLVVAGIFAYRYFSGLLAELEPYFESKPRHIMVDTLVPEEYGIINRKKLQFLDAVKDNQAAELRLTTRELNSIILRSEQFAILQGHVYIRLKEESALLELSIPLTWLGYHSKYLNGSIVLSVLKERDADLDIRVLQAEVKNSPLPDKILKELQRSNLADGIPADENIQKLLERIDIIKIDEGVLIFNSKG